MAKTKIDRITKNLINCLEDKNIRVKKLIGALKEKGLNVTDDTSLKVTIARWLTPSGVSLSENGLDPDVVVEMTPEDLEALRDPQMEKALEILNQ